MRMTARMVLVLFVALQCVLARSPASAEIRQVDGNLWRASSVDQKQAYLIGVANVIQVHQALALRRGQIADDAPIIRILQAMDESSIQTAVDKIDAWYAARPDQLGTPVLGVVWLGLVEAGAAPGASQ